MSITFSVGHSLVFIYLPLFCSLPLSDDTAGVVASSFEAAEISNILPLFSWGQNNSSKMEWGFKNLKKHHNFYLILLSVASP